MDKILKNLNLTEKLEIGSTPNVLQKQIPKARKLLQFFPSQRNLLKYPQYLMQQATTVVNQNGKFPTGTKISDEGR